MLSREEFIRISLETNLFFQRIMKEHLLFIETSLQPVETSLIEEARILKQSFEELLAETVIYADGVISQQVIRSNEIVTPYTLRAEEVTKELTGASIDTSITEAELDLVSGPNGEYSQCLENLVCSINTRSLNLVDEVIAFQKDVLDLALSCRIFITLYPEILEHITGEAIYYRNMLESLQNRMLPETTLCEKLDFWNTTMGEHAQFIDGLLDPSEKDLKETAQNLAEKFEKLVGECIRLPERKILLKSLEATEEVRNFKRTATEGLLECEIKSIILPLLADHVLREANHYLRLLRMLKK